MLNLQVTSANKETQLTPKKAEQNSDFVVKYKTEICKNWELGKCPFNDKCAFAHGYDEVRDKRLPKNYKTKKCSHFHQKGWCPYGLRCQFAHTTFQTPPSKLLLQGASQNASGNSTATNTPLVTPRSINPSRKCSFDPQPACYYKKFLESPESFQKTKPRLNIFIQLQKLGEGQEYSREEVADANNQQFQ